MNILLFVMSLLMMLALLTYGRLDMYRSFVVTQGEFERHMTDGERNAINHGAQQWYDWTTLTTKNGSPKKSAPKDASPRLNLYYLFQPEIQQSRPELESATKELLKKLIYIVFGEQKNFKDALDKNHHLVDELIHAMAAAGSRLTLEKKPIKTTDGLENLELNNPVLQDIYYWMLKGYHRPKPSEESSTVQKQVLDISEETGDREEPTDNQAEEHLHEEGTVSLLDFITVSASKTKIRVFLAPRAILLAIFGDPHTVDEILQNRHEMYLQARNEKDNASLSDQFKQKFASRSINIPESMLDFSVTATDPRAYEIL